MEHEYNKEAVLPLLSTKTERGNDLPFWHWHCFITPRRTRNADQVHRLHAREKEEGL